MEPTVQGEVPKLNQVIQIEEGKIQEHLGEVVRSMVEEMLNAMLDAEADRLAEPNGTNRPRRGRIRGRVPTSGTYKRKRAKSR